MGRRQAGEKAVGVTVAEDLLSCRKLGGTFPGSALDYVYDGGLGWVVPWKQRDVWGSQLCQDKEVFYIYVLGWLSNLDSV